MKHILEIIWHYWRIGAGLSLLFVLYMIIGAYWPRRKRKKRLKRHKGWYVSGKDGIIYRDGNTSNSSTLTSQSSKP